MGGQRAAKKQFENRRRKKKKVQSKNESRLNQEKIRSAKREFEK